MDYTGLVQVVDSAEHLIKQETHTFMIWKFAYLLHENHFLNHISNFNIIVLIKIRKLQTKM
jgi:hypothetical protein